jgi:protease PrsW
VDYATLGILLGLSFLPPIVFALWVRNRERHQREPLGAILGTFVYGGTLGILLALALSLLLDIGFGAAAPALVSLVIIAPFAEELAKGMGLGFVRRNVLELEDGIIYGACIGLGFGATENLLYGLTEYAEDGLGDAVVTISLRVLSSVLLHAGSAALLGYGYGLARLRNAGLGSLLPFYLLAVAQHALYNFLVSQQFLLGFAAAVVMVVVVTTLLARRIKFLDRQPRDAWIPVQR